MAMIGGLPRAPLAFRGGRLKSEGENPRVDPQLFMEIQKRISEAVQERFGVSDEQVMAAIDMYGAKTDPAYKPVLTRIAKTITALHSP